MQINWSKILPLVWQFVITVGQSLIAFFTGGTAISWGSIITAAEELIAALVAVFSAPTTAATSPAS